MSTLCRPRVHSVSYFSISLYERGSRLEQWGIWVNYIRSPHLLPCIAQNQFPSAFQIQGLGAVTLVWVWVLSILSTIISTAHVVCSLNIYDKCIAYSQSCSYTFNPNKSFFRQKKSSSHETLHIWGHINNFLTVFPNKVQNSFLSMDMWSLIFKLMDYSIGSV